MPTTAVASCASCGPSSTSVPLSSRLARVSANGTSPSSKRAGSSLPDPSSAPTCGSSATPEPQLVVGRLIGDRPFRGLHVGSGAVQELLERGRFEERIRRLLRRAGGDDLG